MFINELKQKILTKNENNELNKQRKLAIDELINLYAYQTYLNLKNSILNKAQEKEYVLKGANKVIVGEYTINKLSYNSIPKEFFNLDNKLKENNLNSLFDIKKSPNQSLDHNIKIKSFPVVLVEHKKITEKNIAYNFFKKYITVNDYNHYNFKYNDATIKFLEKVNELAKLDKITLLKSKISCRKYNPYDWDEGYSIIDIEFNDLITFNNEIKLQNEEISYNEKQKTISPTLKILYSVEF